MAVVMGVVVVVGIVIVVVVVVVVVGIVVVVVVVVVDVSISRCVIVVLVVVVDRSGDGCDVSHMINKPMLNKQTTGFRFIPFLRIPRNIPVSIPECPHSAGMIRHRNDENSRPSCQSSFLWNPPDSAGIRGAL